MTPELVTAWAGALAAVFAGWAAVAATQTVRESQRQGRRQLTIELLRDLDRRRDKFWRVDRTLAADTLADAILGGAGLSKETNALRNYLDGVDFLGFAIANGLADESLVIAQLGNLASQEGFVLPLVTEIQLRGKDALAYRYIPPLMKKTRAIPPSTQ